MRNKVQVPSVGLVISDFFEGKKLVVEVSDSESRRFGFGVSRLLVPMGEEHSDKQVVEALGAARTPLVILRADARRGSLSTHLSALTEFECLHADTLVYYRWHIAELNSPLVDHERVSIGLADSVNEILPTINESFAGYRNHYSANPRLADSVTLVAYQEWATDLMKRPDCRVLVARGGKSLDVVGFVLFLINHELQFSEIVLNAVHPDAQRAGIYSHLLLAVREHLKKFSPVQFLYISTQSQNNAVIAAWTKLGLQSYLEINTFHLMHDTIDAVR